MQTSLSRREFICGLSAVGLASLTSVSAAQQPEEAHSPFGWLGSGFSGRTVYERGSSDKVVVLLHELNGLSPGCIDLGVQLVDRGFRVFMPLLFGHPTQDSVFLGSIQSCLFGRFHCFSESSGNHNTPPVEWTHSFVQHLCDQTSVRSIGVIGMCQSGSFPLATMSPDSKVREVVMSQPALPMGEERQKGVGIAHATLESARASKIPILAFRFRTDMLCSEERFAYLECYFGKNQFNGQSFDCAGFHSTLTHRLHAVLTGSCWTVREQARSEVMSFFLKGWHDLLTVYRQDW
jgi:dienelactone hydrolase